MHACTAVCACVCVCTCAVEGSLQLVHFCWLSCMRGHCPPCTTPSAAVRTGCLPVQKASCQGPHQWAVLACCCCWTCLDCSSVGLCPPVALLGAAGKATTSADLEAVVCARSTSSSCLHQPLMAFGRGAQSHDGCLVGEPLSNEHCADVPPEGGCRAMLPKLMQNLADEVMPFGPVST